MKFVILRKPTCMFRPEKNRYHMWDGYAQSKCNFRIDLLEQIKSQPPLEKPVIISVTFYLEPTVKNKKTSLLNMYRFVNNILCGILYKRDTLIHDIKLYKKYDKQPRTEIIIELKEDSENQ